MNVPLVLLRFSQKAYDQIWLDFTVQYKFINKVRFRLLPGIVITTGIDPCIKVWLIILIFTNPFFVIIRYKWQNVAKIVEDKESDKDIRQFKEQHQKETEEATRTCAI